MVVDDRPQQQLDLLQQQREENITPIRLLKSYKKFEEFFQDTRRARVITFSAPPAKLQETFEKYDNLEQLEVIVGDKHDYREELIGKPELANQLERLKTQERLVIYLLESKYKSKIHIKLYILEKMDGSIQILHGSPNFSKNAWDGYRQHESITIFDSPNTQTYDEFNRVWHEEKKHCVKFMDDLTQEIEQSAHADRQEIVRLWIGGEPGSGRQKSDIHSIHQEIIARFSGEPSNAEETLELPMAAYNQDITEDLTKQYKRYGDAEYNEHTRTLKAPPTVISRHYKEHYGIPIMNISADSGVTLGNPDEGRQRLDSPPPDDPETISNALLHIHKYLNSVEQYGMCNNPLEVKTHMYESLLYFFWAPFASIYGRAFKDTGIYRDKNLQFLYIHGESGSGKSTFLEFGLRLISMGVVVNPLGSGRITKTNMETLKHTATCFPVAVDDINKQSIHGAKAGFTNYWPGWHHDSNIPMLIFTSNDSKPKDWFRSRAKMLEFDLQYEGTNESQWHNKKIMQYPNPLFQWFSHQHLKAIKLGKLDPRELDDFLRLTRDIFLDFYDRANLEPPRFFPSKPAEEIHDPGLAVWQDLDLDGKITFEKGRQDNVVVVEFDRDHETYEVKRQMAELPNSVRPQTTGGYTITIRSADKFFDWFGQPSEERCRFWQEGYKNNEFQIQFDDANDKVIAQFKPSADRDLIQEYYNIRPPSFDASIQDNKILIQNIKEFRKWFEDEGFILQAKPPGLWDRLKSVFKG